MPSARPTRHPNAPSLPRYAGFAAVLASAGLPLYIHLPAFLSTRYGITLETLGAVLVALRLVDFVQDPALGWLMARFPAARGVWAVLGGALLVLGMVGLFGVAAPIAPILWIALCLVLAFTGFSLLSILVYADGVARGARLGHVRVAGWREAGSLIGSTLACLLPFVLPGDGYRGFALIVAAGMILALMAMRGRWMRFDITLPPLRALLADRPLRLFLILAFLNALPVAVTSTLFVFFVDYRLQAPGAAGLFLVLFFVSAALSTPAWRSLAERFGILPALSAGMILAMLSFVWAFTLSTGDAPWFVLVCVASGAALGADMMLLPAAFSRQQAQAAAHPALSFGLWNFSGKAALALAAGVVLPLLTWSGFSVHSPATPDGGRALALLYAILPCALKAGALWMAWAVLAPSERAAPLPARPDK